MHYFLFPNKDATIYESHVHQNAGSDQILELEKLLIHTQGDVPWNSRILIKFDLDTFSASLSSGDLSGSDMRYYLNLYTSEAVEIPLDYTVYVYPVGLTPATASYSSSFDNISSGSQYIISTGSALTYIASNPLLTDTGSIYYFLSGSAVSESIGNLTAKINASDISGSVSASAVSSSASTASLFLYAKIGGTDGNSYTFATGSGVTSASFAGGETNIGSWEMGVGKRGDSPITKTGVSWELRTGVTIAGITGSAWTNSGSDFVSGSGYEASQSFDFQSTDLHVDVTTIVESWLDGTLDNHGFLIKRSDSDEDSILNQGTLQFFSNETHTIFKPRLEIIWKDFSYSTTETETTYTYIQTSSSVSMSNNPILSYTTESFYSGSTVFPTASYFTMSGDTSTWYSESYWFETSSIWSYTSSIALYHSSSYVTSSVTQRYAFTSGSDTIYSASILGTTRTYSQFYTGSLGSEFLPATSADVSYSIATPGMTSSDIWNYDQNGSYYYSQSFTGVTASYTYVSSSLVGYATASSSTSTQVIYPISSEDFVVYMSNLYNEYRKDSKVRFRVKGRELYPRKNYVTESWTYTRDEYFLPTQSYYAVRDGWDETEWIPFSSYTQLSVDTSGSFFDLYLNGLAPERLYRIMFKVVQGSIERTIDNNYSFRIIR